MSALVDQGREARPHEGQDADRLTAHRAIDGRERRWPPLRRQRHRVSKFARIWRGRAMPKKISYPKKPFEYEELAALMLPAGVRRTPAGYVHATAGEDRRRSGHALGKSRRTASRPPPPRLAGT
jgi:hypothetical protein